MQRTVWNMRHFQQILKKKGIEFAIFIAPNKEEVYSKYLPDTDVYKRQVIGSMIFTEK